MVLSLESTAARMNRLGSAVLAGLPLLTLDEVVERIDAVTLDDVARAGRRAVRARAPQRGRASAPTRTSSASALEPRRAGAGASAACVIRVAVAAPPAGWAQTVCAAVEGADDMELTGRADPALGTTLADVLGDADVVVDFTQPDTALDNALACVAPACTSSSGRPASTSSRSQRRDGGANVFFAPNFAIGAVLMMRFAAEASRHMAKAEIIELHHDGKLDAPSGTARRPCGRGAAR